MPRWDGEGRRRLRARLAPLVESGNAVCGICGLPIAPEDEWDTDHIVPISVDERRMWSHDNVRPSHARCNRSRGATMALMKRRAAKAGNMPRQRGIFQGQDQPGTVLFPPRVGPLDRSST